MGTTQTALEGQTGGVFGWVAAIEGYPYLLTTAADTSDVTTAWAATDWSQALTGLKVSGQLKQEITAWPQDLGTINQVVLTVQPDSTDQFGIDVWKTKPTFRTELTQLFEPAADGTGTANVRQTSTYHPLASSGVVYMGRSRVSYSALTGTTLTVDAASTLYPFSADGSNVYTRAHHPPLQQNDEAGDFPPVQDVPPSWIGRHVALYMHRILGGTWDTKAEAELMFAGKIVELGQLPDGSTQVVCEDLKSDISGAMLLKDQWVGYVKPGIRLVAGQTLFADEAVSGAYHASGTFSVVASGASGNAEINEGYYSLEEFYSALNAWLGNDASLTATWSIGAAQQEEGGIRTRIVARFSSGADIEIKLHCSNSAILEFLGWPRANLGRDGDGWFVSQRVAAATVTILSDGPPYRVKPMQSSGEIGSQLGGFTVDLESHDGTWTSHTSYLPPPFNAWAAGGDDWSFIKIGEGLAAAKFVSNTQLTDLTIGANFTQAIKWIDGRTGLTVEDDAERLEVRQVVVLSGAISTLIPAFFASIDGNGVNHATYDIFAWGAAIPWSLLGQNFLDSVNNLESATRSHGMLVYLDKPTKLLDVLMPLLQLRFAWLVWNDGGYQFVSPPLPNSTTADWTLDETNKATASADDHGRSEVQVTDEWTYNVVTLNYGRDAAGNYRQHRVIRDQASISRYGEHGVEIDCPNSYTDQDSTGTAVEEAAAALVSRCLPAYSKPLKTIRRTISPQQYTMAPGDTVSLTDDDVRDPVTGQRGLSGRGCTVLSVNVGLWGGWAPDEEAPLLGEVVLLLSDEDRTYPLAPSADVDDTYSTAPFDHGYDSTNFKFRLKAHAYSLAADDEDVTHFAAGDKIRIIEIDPADPTAPDAWSRTIASSGVDTVNGEITLTAALSSPAFDNTKTYRIYPDGYTTVQASQQAVAFQADETDGLILDTALPNLLGDGNPRGWSRTTDGTALTRLVPTELLAEGQPLPPSLLYDLAVGCNNLISYAAAPQQPLILTTSIDINDPDYDLVMSFPWYVGGAFPPGTTRYLHVAPFISVTAGTGYCRVTSSKFPPKGSDLAAPTWDGAKNTAEFTTTDSSAAEATAQTLRIVPSYIPGHTWLTVELKASSGTVSFWGLSRLYLGPVGAP